MNARARASLLSENTKGKMSTKTSAFSTAFSKIKKTGFSVWIDECS
jgi:hypothetical protein